MEHQDWNPTSWNKKPKVIRPRKKINPLDSEEPPPPPAAAKLDERVVVQRARLIKKLTQKQLAIQLNIPVQVINDYESGKTLPPKPTRAKILKILGIKL